MIAAQLLFEFIGRLAPERYLERPEDRPGTLLRRLRSVLDGRRRRQLPPHLSAHLCRDIGLEPPPKAQEWFWPW